MIPKTLDLCGVCAAKLATAYAIRKVAGRVDNKITCAECGRRRYGGTYEVSRKTRSIDRALLDTLDRAGMVQGEEVENRGRG